MNEVTYKGLEFEPYITKEQIDRRVKEIAREIERDCNGKVPLIVCVLTGAFPFAADLMRALSGDAEITFVKLKSYTGTETTGVVKEMMGLQEDIEGRHVVVVEDIVDTGNTLYKLKHDLEERKPSVVKIATLLFKPDALQKPLVPDYVGFEIANKFIIGYGLDLDGLARNLPDIYILKEKKDQDSTTK